MRSGLVALCLAVGLSGSARSETKQNGPLESSLLKVDHRALVARADLVYETPVKAPAEGQPIGNGRMGTMVWTRPGAVHLQINRCDVFAVNKDHTAGAQFGSTDYCGTCAQVTVEVGGRPFEPGDAFRQRLSLHEAEVTVAGKDLRVRCFVSAVADVLALEIDDGRPRPGPLRIRFNQWRPARVTTGAHVATLEFANKRERLLLVQRFREGDYHCASAVAAQVVGRETKPDARNDSPRALIIPAQTGKTLILISSAASREADAGVADEALQVLDAAARRPFDELRRCHVRWWADFWSRTFVHLASADGIADFMARVRNLHLYVMASTSRGALPSKWNGLLFTTEGDARHWGSQFWVWTTEMSYWPLHAADAVDLTEPFFNMYVRQVPACQRAAQQRWGVQGAFYPETTPFDGPVILPEDVAREFRDVYLGRKKNTELSDRARKLGQFDSSLRVFIGKDEMAGGRYTWISHVCSSGAELAVHAWWRYRYTGNKQWLRTHAYPLLRGTAEFYRHLVRKGEDGCYHLHGTNVHEDFWGANDSIMDLAAIRGTVPLAIRASEILGVDAELRAPWRELLDNLAPYPMGSDPESKALTGGVLADDVWAAGHLGEVNGQHNPEDVWLTPVFPFEDWTLETHRPAVDQTVQRTLDLAPRHRSVLNGGALNTAIRTPIAAARAGRGRELPAMPASYYAAFSPLPNGLSLFEGANAQSVEHLGLLSMTLQEGLLQSVSARPGEPEVLSVFPAWPKEWDASFRLLARGGFLVTSAINNGQVEFVEIQSRLGEPCRLRNPWSTWCAVREAGGALQRLDGEILRFKTRPGKRYRVLPEDKPLPAPRRIAPRPATGPYSFTLTLPDGRIVQGTIGRARSQ